MKYGCKTLVILHSNGVFEFLVIICKGKNNSISDVKDSSISFLSGFNGACKLSSA